MQLTSTYLEWAILFEKTSSGWAFKATHPDCHENLTDELNHVSIESAYLNAKNLIRIYQTQAEAVDWLTDLKQNQEISPIAYSKGLSLISRFVATLAPSA